MNREVRISAAAANKLNAERKLSKHLAEQLNESGICGNHPMEISVGHHGLAVRGTDCRAEQKPARAGWTREYGLAWDAVFGGSV